MKERIKEKASQVGAVVGGAVGTVGGLVSGAMVACAEGTSEAVVTSAQMEEITNVITANLGVLLPVGITILGVMIGVALIPRIIYKFF